MLTAAGHRVLVLTTDLPAGPLGAARPRSRAARGATLVDALELGARAWPRAWPSTRPVGSTGPVGELLPGA